jgi:hypothetical protein
MKGLLRFYDVGTGKQRATYNVPESPSEPMRLTVSRDGKLLAVSAEAVVAVLRLDWLLERREGE